jgi:hypothetical protein
MYVDKSNHMLNAYPLPDIWGSEQKSIFAVSWTFQFWTISCFLSLVVQNYQTDISDSCWWGTSLKGGDGALTTDISTRKRNPFIRPIDPAWRTTQWTLTLVMKMNSVLCVFCKDKERGTKFRCSQCSVGLCSNPGFKRCHTKLHFLRLFDVTLEYKK